MLPLVERLDGDSKQAIVVDGYRWKRIMSISRASTQRRRNYTKKPQLSLRNVLARNMCYMALLSATLEMS